MFQEFRNFLCSSLVRHPICLPNPILKNVIGESCVFVPLQEASGGSVCGWSYVAVQMLARTHQ